MNRGSQLKSDWLALLNLDATVAVPTDAFNGFVRLSVFNVFNSRPVLRLQETGTTSAGAPQPVYSLPTSYNAGPLGAYPVRRELLTPGFASANPTPGRSLTGRPFFGWGPRDRSRPFTVADGWRIVEQSRHESTTASAQSVPGPRSPGPGLRADGRVRIPAILTDECAVWWHEHLRQRGDWRQVVNSGDRLFELDRATRQGMTPEQRQALDDAVYAGARNGFQYRYETIRTPDAEAARVASDDPLAAFARWMSQGARLDLLRKIVGDDAVAMARCPGDGLCARRFPDRS